MPAFGTNRTGPCLCSVSVSTLQGWNPFLRQASSFFALRDRPPRRPASAAVIFAIAASPYSQGDVTASSIAFSACRFVLLIRSEVRSKAHGSLAQRARKQAHSKRLQSQTEGKFNSGIRKNARGDAPATGWTGISFFGRHTPFATTVQSTSCRTSTRQRSTVPACR